MTRLKGAALRRRLLKIRTLVLDVDGVLTDGGMYYGPEGDALKKFNVKDGMGIRKVREAGLRVALITGENSQAVLRRAEKLKIEDVYVGVDDKLPVLEDYLRARGFSPTETAYVGDDLGDLEPLKHVGLAVAVADAVPEILKAAHLVTRRRGGDGAVREVCDLLLGAR